MVSPRSSPQLARSSAVVAVGTGLSRLTGFLRVAVVAWAIGASALAEAYNLANNTPNLLYDLVLGGVLSATLVPVVIDAFDRDDKKGIEAITSVVTVLLLLATVIAVAISPIIIWLYNLGADQQQADTQRDVAVPLLMLFAPQILFYGLTAVATAFLNAKRKFAAAAFAPVVNNVVVIALFIGIVSWIGSGNVTFDEVASNTSLLLVMGLGTTLGIAAMAAVLWPALKRARIPLGWNLDFRHPSVVAIAKLSGWTFGYVITNLITYAIFQILANGNDGVTIYAYAWIFFQVPYGLWTVSVMTAYTPELAQLHSQGSREQLSEKFSAGLRLIFVVVLPATVLMALLSQQIVDVVLQHGQFDAASADTTGNTLAALVIGLPAFSLFLYVARGFTSQKDTRTPFILNVAQSVIAIALAFLLVREFGVVGIAAAGTIGYVVLSLIAIGVLDRRIGAIFAKRTRETLLKIVIASALLAGVVFVLRQLTNDLPSLFVLAVCGVVGTIVYFVALHLLHVNEVRQIVARFKR